MSDSLDAITVKQLTWKPCVTRDVAVLIVTKVLASPTRTIWPDEIDIGFVGAHDKNCVGTAWRRMKNVGIIGHGTAFRASKAKGRGGSTIFQYELKSIALAERFLKINGVEIMTRQPELVIG